MSDRPILAGSEWRFYEIVGFVDEDATIINIGMGLQGRGTSYLDSATLEDFGTPIALAEPARPLSSRGLENLIAFTRLLGYVRHFHPSDEATAVDWEVFALENIRSVESAKNNKELIERFDKLFRPIAPTVRVFQTGKSAALPKELMTAKTDGLKIIFWYHLGYGQKNVAQSVYRSERKTRKISADKSLENASNPRRPFAADLGGGVSASIPLALFTDDKGTLPHAVGANQNKESVNKVLYKFSGNDRLTRLTCVALAWNVLQHFYPYFDVVKTDWHKTLENSLTKAATDRDEKEFMLTLRLMVAQLRDGHGNVLDANSASRQMLPVIFRWIENRLVIVRVGDNAQGLQPGDVVISYDSKPSAEAVAEMKAITSGATAQWRRYMAMVRLQIGPKDSEARLEVETATGQRRFVTLRRNTESMDLQERTSAQIEEIKPNIFYVDLDRIKDEDFLAALQKLEKAKGIVFDLRGYPRQVSPIVIQHLIDKPVQSAPWLIPVVKTPDHLSMTDYERSRGWNLEPKAPRLTAKIAFLTDGRAISYAESFMDIIEAYKIAEIVGEPTAGTNGNINPFSLPGGYTIAWTGMKVLKHDSSQHHGVGIQPTVPVSRTVRGIREKHDEQLEHALEIVGQE